MQIRKDGVNKKRVGFVYTGAGPAARDHTEIFNGDKKVGFVTSGSFSPTLGKNIGMAYIDNPLNEVGTKLQAMVRGKPHEIEVSKMPFTPAGYYRGE